MRKSIVVVALAIVLVLALVVPALAMTPANNGMGKMYGEHIRTEAHAGTLGKDVHPGQHHGMSGWTPPTMTLAR